MLSIMCGGIFLAVGAAMIIDAQIEKKSSSTDDLTANYSVGSPEAQIYKITFGQFILPAGWITDGEKANPKGDPSLYLTNFDYAERAARKEYAIPSNGGSISITKISNKQKFALEKYVASSTSFWLGLSDTAEVISTKNILVDTREAIQVEMSFPDRTRPRIENRVYVSTEEGAILYFDVTLRPDAPSREKIIKDFQDLVDTFTFLVP